MSTELAQTNGKELALPELAQKMPELLTKSRAALEGATAAVAKLPAITDEASKEAAFALKKNIKSALDTYYELRMPFTRKLDEYKKNFTGTEAGFQALIDK